MKKVLLLLLTVMLGFGSWQVSAQETLTVHNGTTTNSYVPVYGFYADAYLKAEFVMPASELADMSGGQITGMKFYSSTSSVNWGSANFQVFLTEVNETTLSAFTGTTNTTIVYTGSLSISNGEMDITFTTPYTYSGGNLLIGVYNTVIGTYVSSSWYGETVNGASIQGYSYSDLGSVTPTQRNFLPKTTFTYSTGSISCGATGNLTVSNITAYNADIAWGMPADAGSYILQYKTSDLDWSDNGVFTDYPSDTTYSFSTPLIPATTYNVRVANICTSGDTSFWRSASFTTACAPIDTLPYTENFDTYGTGGASNYPDCWTKLTTYTSSMALPYISSTSYQGSGALYFYVGTATQYNMAIMPSVDELYPINTLQVSFAYRGSNATDRLIVGVLDDFTDASTFTPVDTVYPVTGSAGTWDERIVTFDNYQGTGTYIAFKNEYTSTYCYSYVDNLVLETIIPCSKPSNVVISNYTAEGADVDWTPGAGEDSWEVVAVPANADVTTGTPEPASSHPYTLTGLNANTAYDVYVRGVCGSGETSGWTFKRSFTTNMTCSTPQNVTVSQITTNSALVTWNDAVFGATSYTLGYSEADQNNWTSQPVNGTQYMISGLNINTEYDVFVVSNCTVGEADTVFTSFTTRSCMVGGDLEIGNGTSTSSYLPEYCLYNYSYTQQIYLASEMNGAAEISSIAFNASSIGNPSRHLMIYLMHTTAASGEWLPASSAQLVYDNTTNMVAGWNTFNFSTPFQYNGIDNLAVIVSDVTGSWSGTNSFYSHTTNQSLSHYAYQDSGAYSVNSIPTSGTGNSETTSRNNVIFGIPCDSISTCVAPNPYVTAVTDNSVTVAWTPGNTETSWELEYTTDSVWTSAGPVTSPYTISGLSDNMDVIVRVRSLCSGSETSQWAVTSARTNCPVVNALPLTENFDEVTSSGPENTVHCWSALTNSTTSYPYITSSYANSGDYSVYCAGSNTIFSYLITPEFDASIPLNTLQVRFMAYKTSPVYYIQVGVMTDPNDYSTFTLLSENLSPDTISEWRMIEADLDSYTGDGHYIALRIPQSYSSYMYVDDIYIDVIPTCAHVDSIRVTDVQANSATISWTPGGSESMWDVAVVPGTGAVDFDTLNLITVNGTPSVTVSDLEQNTLYTAYVRSNCGGEQSFWMSTTFMTTQVPATLPYYCDFEDPDQIAEFAFVNGTQTNRWYVGTATNNGGTHALYISSNNGNGHSYNTGSSSTVWVYRDVEFPASPSGYTLSFDWHCYGESGYDFMNVYVGTPSMVTAGVPSTLYSGNIANPAGTIALQATTNSSYPYYFNLNSNYQTYSATLPALTETTIQRIYFLWRNDASSGEVPPAAIDNISIMPIHCDAPTALTLDSVSGNTADISWTSAAASSVITYKGDNDADWIEIDPATSPYQLTNLTANTHYIVRVANHCDDGVNTSPSATLSFFTDCDIINTLPYMEYFDNYSASNSTRPNCWAFPVIYSDAPYITSGHSSSSPNSLFFQSETTNPTTAVSPQFGADINTLRVKFMLQAESTTSSGTFEVGVMSDPTDVTTFESVRIIQPVNTDWNQYVVDFDSTAMTGQGRYIAFRQHSNSSVYYYWLDNVQVMPIPSCSEPANVTMSVGIDEVEVNWEEVPGEGTYEVYLYPANQTPDYTQAVTVTTNSYSEQNLESGASYVVMIRTVCSSGDGYSDWTISSFATLSGLPAELPYTCSFDDGEENALWMMVNGSETNKWYIGQPTGATDSVLFISSNGTSATYANTNSAVWAYRDIHFGEGAEFNLDIKWKCQGEGSYDFMRVIFGNPASVVPGDSTRPSGTFVLDRLNLQSDWQHFTHNFDASYANSTHRLYFMWRNDGSIQNDPSAVIDSIVITASACGRPYGLSADNVQPYSADITFSPAMPSDVSWEYAICTGTETADNAAITGQATATTFTVSTLMPETHYTAYVRTICDDGSTSNWSNSVSFTTPPTCPAVTNVTVTATSGTSVTLDWQPGGSETTWEIAYGTGAVDPNNASTDVVTTSAHPFEVQNLSSATSYQFYVRAICTSDDNSAWSNAVSAATQCSGAVAIPYSESFDSYVNGISSGTGYPSGYPDGDMPSCWTFLNRSSNTTDYPMAFLSSSTTYAVSGNCLFFKSSSDTPLYAILPDFSEDIQDLTLQYTYRNEGTTDYNGTLSVGYITDLNDASSFTELVVLPRTTTLTVDTVEFGTVPATVTNAYIAFKYTGGSTNNYYLSIDNVSVTLTGSGPQPTNPTVATNAALPVEQTTATLNATITNPDNVSISAKGFEWKATAGGTYTQVAGTGTGNTFSAALSNLTPNTSYTFKAFITFNGQTVYGDELTFTTLEQGVEPCAVPTGLTATDITGESVTITWNNADVSGWNIQYRPQGGQLSTATSTTNSYTISGLVSNTTYEIQVQANCGNGNLSDWSPAITVTTTGIENWLENSVTLFPNPAREYIDIRVDGDLNVTMMEVYDVYGKLINTVGVCDTPVQTRINVSGLADGMYFVRVTTEVGTVTKSFVKK